MTTRSVNGGCAKHVGRIGALAVALGIGAAIANSPGIATADTGESDSSSHSSHSSASKSDHSDKRSKSKRRTQKPVASDTKTSTSSDDGSTTSGTKSTTKRQRPTLSDHIDRAAKAVQSVTKSEPATGTADAEKAPTSETSEKPEKSAARDTLPQAVSRTLSDTADRIAERTKEVTRRAADHRTTATPAVTPQRRLLTHTPTAEPATPVAKREAPEAGQQPAVEPVISLKQAPTLTPVRALQHAAVPTAEARPAPTPTEPPTPARVVTQIVSSLFSVDGLGSHAANTPATPPHNVGLWAVLGWARRESQKSLLGDTQARTLQTVPTAATVTSEPSSPLATEDQLAAEQQISQIVDTPVVQLAKGVLKVVWYAQALKNFSAVGGPDAANLAQLDAAAEEYANQSATEFLLLNSNNPKLLLQVNPPHSWYGQDAGGTRVWYDNPDTVYRFTGVNAASEYVIKGHINPGTDPTDTNFSVLTGITGDTAANLSGKDLVVDENGDFTITVSSKPAGPDDVNHLQLPSNATILTTRNTMSDWNSQEPMTLSIERVSGPPESLFGQIGGFAIPGIGPAVVDNPTLLNVVSSIPAFDEAPLLLSSTETALLMMVTGISGENTYMSVATTDPVTGELREPNTLSEPAHNASFLANQLQSAGYFQLDDDEAMIVTVDPGTATYFSVPVYNDWTITDNYWDQQTSLNNGQAIQNLDENGNPDGTYTVVISKNDPQVANWVSTGGLNQGTISMRFQGVDPDSPDVPTVHTQVVPLDQVRDYVQDNQDSYDREQQINDRQDGYNNRYAPYTQV